jgi:hypothetical protein
VLEGSDEPGAKEPLVVYNSYLRFCCLALLEADSYVLFAVADVGGLADVLMSTVVDPKDLRWVVPRMCESV